MTPARANSSDEAQVQPGQPKSLLRPELSPVPLMGHVGSVGVIEAHRKLVQAARGLPGSGMAGLLRPRILRTLENPSITLDGPKLCKIGRTIQHALELVVLWTPNEWDDGIPVLIDEALDLLGCDD